MASSTPEIPNCINLLDPIVDLFLPNRSIGFGFEPWAVRWINLDWAYVGPHSFFGSKLFFLPKFEDFFKTI